MSNRTTLQINIYSPYDKAIFFHADTKHVQIFICYQKKYYWVTHLSNFYQVLTHKLGATFRRIFTMYT